MSMSNHEYKVHTYNNVSLNDINKFINVVNAEIIDCRIGSLIDYMLIATDYFWIACYETYKNAWSSVYTLQVQHYNDNYTSDVIINWDKFTERYDKEYGGNTND